MKAYTILCVWGGGDWTQGLVLVGGYTTTWHISSSTTFLFIDTPSFINAASRGGRHGRMIILDATESW
jgi:hypothetical protein